MVKKTFLVWFVFVIAGNFASASVDYINYKATFGVFGTVGTLNNKIIKNKKTYEIECKITVQGLAKMLMDGHTERHISKGRLVNGIMISDFYQAIQKSKNKTISKEYHINHKKKYVIKKIRKWKYGKLVKSTEEKLKFYAKDDLLTLYFNLGHAVKLKGKTYKFKAVGLEKQKGIVYITIPKASQVAPYVEDLGEGAMLYAKAGIKQRNFKKDRGDILISLAKDHYIEKSVIKDVLLYGDAKIERLR
jgi:hypothetical protein